MRRRIARFRILVEEADEEAADLLPAVDEIVGRNEGGRFAGQARRDIGDQIHVLARPLRERDAERQEQGARPQASGDDDNVGVDEFSVRNDASNAAALLDDRLDLHALANFRSGQPRGLRIGCRQSCRIEPPAHRIEPDALGGGGIEQGIELFALLLPSIQRPLMPRSAATAAKPSKVSSI